MQALCAFTAGARLLILHFTIISVLREAKISPRKYIFRLRLDYHRSGIHGRSEHSRCPRPEISNQLPAPTHARNTPHTHQMSLRNRVILRVSHYEGCGFAVPMSVAAAPYIAISSLSGAFVDADRCAKLYLGFTAPLPIRKGCQKNKNKIKSNLLPLRLNFGRNSQPSFFFQLKCADHMLPCLV